MGSLVLGAQMSLSEVERSDIDNALFENYLDGLREGACHVDPQQVRFGYVTMAALRIGLFRLFVLGKRIKASVENPLPAVEHSATPDIFEVVMADESFSLVDSIVF